MSLKTLGPFVLIAALAACATGKADRSPAAGPDISLATLTTVTQTLSSDSFEGRAPTTAGEEKAVALIADRFRKAGLEPGNSGSWYQEVPLVETIAAPTALEIEGGGAPIRLTYRTDFVANSYQIQPRVRLSDSELVFVGYGINAPERGWNDYEGVDVRGKTVVILVNDPDWQQSDLGGRFNGKAMTYYGRWTYKFEEAARRGAAGVLIVHETAPASYGWNTVKNSNTNVMFDIVRKDPTTDHTPLDSWIQRDLATAIFAASGKDFEAAKQAAKRKDFQP
ncbi:MAG TPA: peptidase M28, partial [Allosphingosinicella sp.]